jgi:asparagine synthase (glutamine-hydrolysing)
MCGIIIVYKTAQSTTTKSKSATTKSQVSDLARLIRHRGPDYSGIVTNEDGTLIMAHERLVIVDPNNGSQPFKSENGDLLAVNGEIYNHQELRNKYHYDYKTKSDCEIMISPDFDLLNNPECLDDLDGMFAFGKWYNESKTLVIARDPIGIIPLYYGFKNNGQELWVSSELKVLEAANVEYQAFPPRSFAIGVTTGTGISLTIKHSKDYVPLLETQNIELKNYPQPGLSLEQTQKLIRKGLKQAVHKQLMSDVPYGALLSGGLDSSLITSIASRYVGKRIEDNDKSVAHWPRLHTFSVGLSDSPDLIQAKKVAEFLGTVHHEWVYTVEEGIDALRDVIWYTETYDVTTIRASTPMYLLSKKIKSIGVKMVLSGEGSDELFGGYLYFHKCKNPEDFYHETVRKVRDLHKYDCLRANKATAAASLEIRPPFLDIRFVRDVLNIDPKFKLITPEQPMEKWILRSAFAGKYLPDEILWRQKEQFSDAVGYSWIDGLKDYTSKMVTDEEFDKVSERFPINTPKTKEAYYYRSIFEEFYPSESAINTVPHCNSVACSSEKALEWDPSFKNMIDPSGRAVNVHNHTIV